MKLFLPLFAVSVCSLAGISNYLTFNVSYNLGLAHGYDSNRISSAKIIARETDNPFDFELDIYLTKEGGRGFQVFSNPVIEYQDKSFDRVAKMPRILLDANYNPNSMCQIGDEFREDSLEARTFEL